MQRRRLKNNNRKIESLISLKEKDLWIMPKKIIRIRKMNKRKTIKTRRKIRKRIKH